jgi:thiol-disulfide isomerase/thioredoxin
MPLARFVGVALVLIGGAALGFLLQRLTRPPATFYAVPPTATAPPAASRRAAVLPGAAGAAEAPSARVVPEQVPDLELPDLQGRMHRLAEWRGKPLLINFWATWCEPCRREIPLLEQLWHEQAPQGLEVVGIAVDHRPAVGAYASARGIEYPVLVGEQGGLAAVNAFGMDTVLPFSVFADSGGQVIALKVGELHRDEAEFILGRIRELDTGRLSLGAARETISAGVQRLNAARRASRTPDGH